MIVTMLFRFILNIVLCKSILDEDIMKELEGDNKAKVKFLNSKEEKKMYMEERGINY